MLEKIEGIVVSETSYGESSKIINILTFFIYITKFVKSTITTLSFNIKKK